MAPLLAAGLTRQELALVSMGTSTSAQQRLDRLEELISEIDRELLAIVVQVRTGQAGERASLASVIRLAVRELQASPEDRADHGRAKLIARLLQLASSCLEPDRTRDPRSRAPRSSMPV